MEGSVPLTMSPPLQEIVNILEKEFYDPLSRGALSELVLEAKHGGRNRGVSLGKLTYNLERGYGTQGKYGAPFSFDDSAVSDAVVAAPNLKFIQGGNVVRVWGSRDDLVAYIDHNFGDGYAHTAPHTSVEAGNWIALSDMVRTWPKLVESSIKSAQVLDVAHLCTNAVLDLSRTKMRKRPELSDDEIVAKVKKLCSRWLARQTASSSHSIKTSCTALAKQRAFTRKFVSREDIQRVLATCDDVTLDGDSVVYPKQVAVAPTPAAGGGDGGKVAEEADESSFPVTDLVALLESAFGDPLKHQQLGALVMEGKKDGDNHGVRFGMLLYVLEQLYGTHGAYGMPETFSAELLREAVRQAPNLSFNEEGNVVREWGSTDDRDPAAAAAWRADYNKKVEEARKRRYRR